MTPPKSPSRRLPSRKPDPPPLEGTGKAHVPVLGGSRKGATQARSKETVAAILEAAACLLEESGYRAASTNAIARRAGVSIGSLYQFFSSREDVFRALLAQHKAEVHEVALRSLVPVFAGESQPADVLPRVLQEMMDLHRGRPRLMRAMGTELAHLTTDVERREEAIEMAGLVSRIAARLSGAPEHAMAKSWLAAEMTAQIARILAHDPPDYLDLAEAQSVYIQIMKQLLQ